MSAAVVPVGVCFLVSSFTFATIAAYYRKKYEGLSVESYPVLSLAHDTSHLKSIFIKNSPKHTALFTVEDEQSQVLYQIEKNKVLKAIWFLMDMQQKKILWTIKASKNGAVLFDIKTKTSFAVSADHGDPDSVSVLKYIYTNLKFNEFTVSSANNYTHSASGTPSQIEADYSTVEYRWLYDSKYLEKIDSKVKDKMVNEPVHKRVALAINMGEEKSSKANKGVYSYQIIYNEREIDVQILVISTFLSIMSQWKHIKTCDKNLKEKATQWNLNRANPVPTGTLPRLPGKDKTKKKNAPEVTELAKSHLARRTPDKVADINKPKPSKYSKSSKIKQQNLNLKEFEKSHYSGRYLLGTHKKKKLKKRIESRTNQAIDKTNKRVASYLSHETSASLASSNDN